MQEIPAATVYISFNGIFLIQLFTIYADFNNIIKTLSEHKMVLEINLKPESVTSLERFLNTNTYKELAESTMSFNRRLNEERKMRIPYIDGQTGVAQVGGVLERTLSFFKGQKNGQKTKNNLLCIR